MRISKTSDAKHKRLSILLWGEPKVGKTRIAKTLNVDADDKVLYIGVDPGQLSIRERGFTCLHPDGGKLNEKFFKDVLSYIEQNADKYDWIYVDGVDELADAILKEKMESQRNGMKAYGEMAEFVEWWMKAVRDVEGVSTVFTTHMDRRDDGEGGVEFLPLFPGKQIQTQVNGWFDLIGCMRLVKDVNGNVIDLIQFNRKVDTKYMVGDRSGALLDYEAPDLGVIFKKIHEAGFETKGTFDPKIPVNKKDIDALALAIQQSNKVDLAEVSAYAKEKFGVMVSQTTQSQFNQIKEWLKEKGVA